MSHFDKDYSTGDVTIHWKSRLCRHSANCFRGLPGVFHPQELPWITPERGSTEQIIAAVHTCPSGALTVTDHRPGQAASGS
jgi:uncharacterized Fe-S cluster protein YjdI